MKRVVTGIEMFGSCWTKAGGDNVGAAEGNEKEEVERGQVLCKPASITRTRSSRRKRTY